jgi:hypothetical protein
LPTPEGPHSTRGAGPDIPHTTDPLLQQMYVLAIRYGTSIPGGVADPDLVRSRIGIVP